MAQKQIFKTPTEQWPVEVDFNNKLPEGLSITSGTVTAVDIADNTDQTSAILLSGTCSVTGTKVGFAVKAGIDKHRYKVTMLVTLSDGSSKLEETITVNVDTEEP